LYILIGFVACVFLQVDPASGRRLSVAWHPDGGTFLAVPGTEQDIVLLERLSWQPASYLTGGHKADVDTIAFSPNGNG
jgi:WD40 repeat protein